MPVTLARESLSICYFALSRADRESQAKDHRCKHCPNDRY